MKTAIGAIWVLIIVLTEKEIERLEETARKRSRHGTATRQ
jgi:hypothetical protein